MIIVNTCSFIQASKEESIEAAFAIIRAADAVVDWANLSMQECMNRYN